VTSGQSQETEYRDLLLVDDDPAFRKVYRDLLEQAGYRVVEAVDRESARSAVRKRLFAVVLLDLMLPPDGQVEPGLAQLVDLLGVRPETKVVVVSGAGDVPHMVQAVRSGAYDFLTKPVDPDVLLIVVQRAMARFLLERQLQQLRSSLDEGRPGAVMVGTSPSFRDAVSLAERVATSPLPVLISGETGTGKELMARTVHERSGRGGPFLAVNCGALPEGLLESTLFGHLKGAFTGAERDRRGLFLEADGGTLFLDEIGDTPPALQVKLLRVIDGGELLPVGSDRPLHADARVVAATHKDLRSMMEAADFREDLYWRIRGAEIRMPPLRERGEDMLLLARHFLNLSAPLCPDGRAKELSEGAQSAVLRHLWPGNLRELRFEMQRASVLAGQRREILETDLVFVDEGQVSRDSEARTLQQRVEEVERQEIRAALIRFDNNRTRAAEALGLSRQGLLKKMARYALD
jgi:DNA-binding NtrC family response regulator